MRFITIHDDKRKEYDDNDQHSIFGNDRVAKANTAYRRDTRDGIGIGKIKC